MATPVVGVLLEVLGLGEFLGDLDTATSALEKLAGPQTSLIGDVFENTFGKAGAALANFAEKIWDVASVAIGVMLRDAIEWAIGALGDLVTAAFEAGNEFQMMSFRLQGFNLEDAIASVGNYDEAMGLAVETTKEQMDWVMRLAATTPFDATDVGNTFTLSRSYGFTADEAKRLTGNILDYTAAMGLSGVEMERVIVNLGQMEQRGKVTTREMNDLARGAFVPITDILDRMAEKMGSTREELLKLISKPGGGVDPTYFIESFNEMIEQEARFEDASARMAHTFKGATENVQQTMRDVIGGYILLPGILDPIGKAVGNIMDSIGKRWDDITVGALRVGSAISDIVTTLLNTFLPTGDEIADGLVGGLNSVADWIETNKEGIIQFFVNIGTTIKDDIIPFIRDELIPAIGRFIGWIIDNKEEILGFFTKIGLIIFESVVPFVRDHLVPAFETISTWITENGPTIKEFFLSLVQIVGNVFEKLFPEKKEGRGEEETGLEKFLNAIKLGMEWLIENKQKVSDVIAEIVKFIAIFAVAQAAILLAVSAITGALSLLLAHTVDIAALIIASVVYLYTNVEDTFNRIVEGIVYDINAVIAFFIVALPTIKNSFISVWQDMKSSVIQVWQDIKTAVPLFWNEVKNAFVAVWQEIKNGVTQVWQDISTTISNWYQLGSDIVQGLIDGVINMGSTMIDSIVNLATSAWEAAKNALGISSPSKLFFDIGLDITAGMTGGVLQKARSLADAVTKVATSAWSAAQRFGMDSYPYSYGNMTKAVAYSSPSNAGSSNVSNSSEVVNKYMNLTVHTRSNIEPIIQDFGMLASL